MPEDKLVNLGGTIEGFPRTPIVPDIPSPIIGAQPGTNKSFDDLFAEGLSTVKFKGKENIPLSSIYTGSRFPESRPGSDPEEMAARQQEWTDKWGNSIAKFAGTTATTFVSGTAGLLWGVGSAVANWNFSSLIKNDVTEAMDQTMKEFDDYAPNYYTQNERDAEFLSSDNLLTANFWGDKVFRNLGYSIGSLGGGLAWSKVFKMIGATNALVKAGKGLETATALETAMTNVPKVQKFAALESTINTLGQKYIKNPLGSVLSDADRVLTSTMGTFGEASMEGLQNMNAFRDKAIEEYRNKYGFTPTGTDLAEIDAYSQKIGNYTWGMNTLLLSATNYIQLPKILNSSRKGERAMINDIGQAEIGGAFSKMVPANKVLDIYSKAKGASRFLFSGSEAFEEGAQSAIQIGTDNYFNRAYTNKQDLKSFLSAMNGVMSNIVSEGVEETLGSKEGLESILIGGLSGGIQQARGNYKQGGLYGQGGIIGKNTDVAIQAINNTNIKQTLAEQAKYIAIGLGSQKLRQAAILNNDKLNEKDYESDFTLSYIMPRAKYGKADSIYNELSYYESQALSQGGFEELQTKGIANQIETREQFLERIQGIKATTKIVDSLYTSIQDKYIGETTEDGKQKYSNQNIDSLVYAASKINHYDSRIPQVNTALNISGISTIDVLEGIITDSKPNKEATETAIAQINAMDVVDDTKTDLKRDLSDVIELSMRRKQFIKDYNRISNDPSKARTLEDFDLYTEEEMFAEVDQEIVPEGKVRKKIVKKELEVGKEYSLKQPFIRRGNQLQLSPKIGIVSKVLGGEFEVVLPNGQTTFLTPEEFKQFDISDRSNDSEALAVSMEKAIDSVLSSKKYSNIVKPEFTSREDKLEFINSLDNTELVNDIENLFNKNYSEIIKLEEQKEKEEDFLNEDEIIDEIIDDLDNSQPTLEVEDAVYEYQFRKEIFIIPSATTASTGKPHHVRANAFGTRLDKLPNKDNIRGLYITQSNEKALGLEGLTTHLVKESNAISKTVIALVMIEVDPKTGKRFFVDEFGKRISKPTVNNTIYQVFPLEDLSWDSKWSKDGKRESMFRVGTPKEHEEAVRAQYAKWRANTLKKTPTEPVEIEASFGFPEYVQTELDEEGNSMDDFSARVSVVDSGLITDAALSNNPVIFIPTVEETISKGSTSFSNVKGIPFLSLRDAYVPLSNRILTPNEVNVVFDAIVAFANNFQKSRFASEKEKAELKNKRKVITDWLKTVVYWGTPETSKGVAKDASTNSIWFEKVDNSLVLFVSNNNDNFSLSPIALAQNETKIKKLLSGMYNNINATRVKGGNDIAWDAPYSEITSITPDGAITTKEWNNYQTYLLSGKGRTTDSLPLATNIRPLKTSEDVNREGVYFIVPHLQGTYDLPESVETETEEEEPGAIAKTITPGKPIVPVAPAPKKPSSAKQFDLRKGVINTLKTSEGIIRFEAIEDKVLNAKPGQELNSIKIDYKDADTAEYLKKYVDAYQEIQNKENLENPSRSAVINDAKAALESVVYNAIINTQAAPEVVTPTAPVATPTKGPIKSNARRAATRLKIQRDIANTKFEDWGEVESFIKVNYPNIPVYRVKNMIRATNGREAWGMYQDGAIYIYENAEVGTAYHEVFHAIWRMSTSSAERRDIAKEFKSREGQFFDRESTTYIQYSKATDEQLEEALAEEFRDYVQYKKVPVKPKDSRNFIQRAFADLLNLIKTFFAGKKAKINSEELFNRIGNGYYKTYNQDKYALSFAKKGVIDIEDAYATDEAAFLLKNLSGQNVNDIIQEMNYRTIGRLVTGNQDLFTVNSLNRKELYPILKDDVLQNVDNLIDTAEKLYNEEGISEDEQLSLEAQLEKYLKLKENIVNEWDNIAKIHEDSLKSYSIEFDENDNTTLTSDERTRESGWGDANKIDSFRKASTAIKLLLSTVPYMETLEDGSVVTQESSVGGAILIPTSQVYMSVMSNVHNNLTVEEMMESLRKMALADSNYASLYRRLTKNKSITDPADLTTLLNNNYDAQLLTSFWSTFKKQNPDVQTVFVLENGNIVVGDSNFTTAARQLREKFRNSIIRTMKDPNNKFFYYDTNKKAYFGKKGSVAYVKSDTSSRIKFLKDLGIDFERADIVRLTGKDPQVFATAVDAIKTEINQAQAIATSGYKMLDISGRLLELGIVKAKIDNPEFSSTYFNVNGERTQTFIGTNALSDLYDFLSKLNAFTPANLAGTPYEYLLTDKFAKESTILNRMFDMESAEKLKRDVTNVEGLMKPAYADGIVDSQNGTKKQSSKLQIRDRIIQELNLNLAGYYMNLVPGSASLEWMVKMDNPITAQNISNNFDAIFKVFKGYFMSEMAVSREKNRSIVVIGERKKTDLRFLKPILGKELHDRLVGKSGKIEDIYDDNVEEINEAITAYIEKDTKSFRKNLELYDIITPSKTSQGNPIEGLNDFNSISLVNSTRLTEEKLMLQLTALNVSFIINNIELHKLVYSDPYQYKDELKRTKLFNSSSQPLVSSKEMNTLFNKVWNKGYKVGDIGYTNFTRGYFRTVTLDDVVSASDMKDYVDGWKETDGGGIITMKAYRNFRIRAGSWISDKEELQYEYEVKFENLVKSGASVEEINEFMLQNPKIKSALTPIKPKAIGGKNNDKKYKDIVADKFALYPLSYSVLYQLAPKNKNGSVIETNAMKHYDKMQKEFIAYSIFESGRKVGSEEKHSLYNLADGSFNTEPYKGVINIPFNILSVQSEVPSKDTPNITRGSQVTKLVTLDLMDVGVPVDFMEDRPFAERYEAWTNPELTEDQKKTDSPLYKEIKNNQFLLEELMREGYLDLLDRLAIKEENKQYVITDFSVAAKTLRDEIFKNEVNYNISEALNAFLNGKAVIESTPAYQQIRNILYSIADKNIVSPSISGGFKVQISPALFETTKIKPEKYINKEGQTKYRYTSDLLDFYSMTEKDGKKKVNVCEIMIGRWFESDMSDEDLLDYLNNTTEGQKILSGFAFRIPTQKQNSIEVFKIKQFLPKEFGDSVVVPSALVNKTGSDFDIDKLSIYLKNVFKDVDNKLKLVEYKGSKEATIQFYEDVFNKKLAANKVRKELALLRASNNIDKIDTLLRIEDEGARRRALSKNEYLKDLIEEFGDDFEDAASFLETKVKSLREIIGELNSKQIQAEFRKYYVTKKYKQALENLYIESSVNLASTPYNYERLIKPNSAQGLEDLTKKVLKKLGFDAFDYKNTKNLINRTFMIRLRQAYVSGKYAIGIVAQAQTNLSLNQRTNIYIDPTKAKLQSAQDKEYLKDGNLRFAKYNKVKVNGKDRLSLSRIQNVANEDISDLISQVMDGYLDIDNNPWVMELGITPNVAPTWLFLIKAGVPMDQIAYFMNQPIIKDYLRSIENSGYTWLFIDDIRDEIKSSPKYDVSQAEVNKITVIPGKDYLYESIGRIGFSLDSRARQQFMLDEFLKYAKMANQLFLVTQATTFDTATFNDPFLVFKKLKQLEKAQTTIISSVNHILDNSFLRELSETIKQFKKAYSAILLSENPVVNDTLEKVLAPYIDLSDRDFVKLAQKAVADLFDWSVQNSRNLNQRIPSLLISNETNTAKEFAEFVNTVKSDFTHPLYNNQIINIYDPQFSSIEGGVNNMSLINKDNKVYDQNRIIYGFMELKEHLKNIGNIELYNKIVETSILQSGLSTSKISFTNLLPYGDVAEIYNKTLSNLGSNDTFVLNDFYTLGVFERNNWSNDDIVPRRKAKWKKGSEYTPAVYNANMTFGTAEINDAMLTGDLPALLKLSSVSREASRDYVVYSWEDQALSQATRDAMKKANDYSYIKKGLFKKVYNGTEALRLTNIIRVKTADGKYVPKEIYTYIYKQINAWGDSFRANEFYSVPRTSVIENGFLEVENEVSDMEVSKYFIAKLRGKTDATANFSTEGDLLPEVGESKNIGSDTNDPNILFGLDIANRDNLEFHINTLNVVGSFLENIGIEQRFVPEFLALNTEGSVIEGAIAAANFIEGTVDIIEDVNKRPAAWNKLPEEAAHWWYRLLDTNSPLKDALLTASLTDRKEEELRKSLYGDAYSGVKVVGKLALDAQGSITSKPALSPIREEAIGQLIAEAIKRIETNNANASDYSFFREFLDWINRLIDAFKNTTQDPFEVAAMKILASDMSDLMTLQEYRKLNNIVNFSNVLTEQSVAPVDYTIISDIGNLVTNYFEPQEMGEKDYFQFVYDKYNPINPTSDSPIFSTQQELDNWVLANVKELNQRQEKIIQEVRDNEQFFDRLLNKSFRKKSKYLPKTLRKYFKIIDTANITNLKEWNISQEMQREITKKLTEQEKKQIINTNGYMNIAPTLKVLPDLLKKYGRKTTPEILKQEIELTLRLVKKEISKEQGKELQQKLDNKKKGNPIVLSEPIKIDGAKKQELSILNGIKDMIRLENPGIKTITAEEFVSEAHNWLQTNYLLGFANEDAYLSYRTDQTFSYLKDRISNEDIDLQQFTDAEMMAMPPADRQRLATMMGLTKQNPDVYHNKVSLRFNDMYHLKGGHFPKSPSAWGNLTYFYTGKNKWKDAVLLHEIQNDNIEFLRDYQAEKVDLETSLGRYLQDLNIRFLDNLEQISSGGKKIQKTSIYERPVQQYTQLNYQLNQIANLPLRQGLNQLKEGLNERINLYEYGVYTTTPEKAQEQVEKAYAKRRTFVNFQNRGGIKSLISAEDIARLKSILEDLNTSTIMTGATFLVEENQYEPGYETIRDLKLKKQDFKLATKALVSDINLKIKEIYGEDAPILSLTAPAKPLPRSSRRMGNVSQDLNESVNFLLLFSEQQINKQLSKNIEEAKRTYVIVRNARMAYNFNTSLYKITPEQYATLIENYKYNELLLERLVDEQAKKDVEKESIDISKLSDEEVKKDITGTFEEPNEIDVFGGTKFLYRNLVLSSETIEEAVIEIRDRFDPRNAKNKQQLRYDYLQKLALEKKEELEKNYGSIEEEIKQTLEVEMNYFTPLVHHLIQKHINQYGKDFPMYFSGYNITKLTQGNDRTAMIYAGKDEIDIVDRKDFFVDGKAFRKFDDGSIIITDVILDKEGRILGRQNQVKGTQQEYEKAYQKATEQKAKEIKYEAAQKLGLIPIISYDEKVSLEEGIKKLNEFKKQSKQNLDRAVNTIMNISNNKPIETGAIYNAMTQVSGVKLIWQEKIEGLKNNAGGYLVDLSNYNYNTPILYGLQNPTQPSADVKPNGITQKEWDGLSQEEKNKINEC